MPLCPGVNHEVFTTKFFGQVQDELQNEIGIQKLAFSAAKWVCPGALVLVGRAQRRELIDELEVLKGIQKQNYVGVLREVITKPSTIKTVRLRPSGPSGPRVPPPHHHTPTQCPNVCCPCAAQRP
jgi:hypothetical protein